MIIKFNHKELQDARKEILKSISVFEFRQIVGGAIKGEVEKLFKNFVDELIKEKIAKRIQQIIKKEIRNDIIKIKKVTAKDIIGKIDTLKIEKECKKLFLEQLKKKVNDE